MGLHWNLSKIANSDQVCWDKDGKMNHATESLIWATLGVDLSGITEKNWREFAIRLYMRERVVGPYRQKVGADHKIEDIYFTIEEIKQHIGLSTNVANKTRGQFMKNLMGSVERRAVQWLHRQEDEASHKQEVAEEMKGNQ